MSKGESDPCTSEHRTQGYHCMMLQSKNSYLEGQDSCLKVKSGCTITKEILMYLANVHDDIISFIDYLIQVSFQFLSFMTCMKLSPIFLRAQILIIYTLKFLSQTKTSYLCHFDILVQVTPLNCAPFYACY